ncbi:unnamed protein product [Ixodes pacificus]
MQPVRNRRLIELFSNLKAKQLQKLPTYIEMSVLVLSKTLMYDFHYNGMKKRYGEGIKMLYKDTDSLIYVIQTEDI